MNAFLEQPNYLKLPNSTTYHKSYFISDMFSLMSLIFAFQMTSNILHIVQAMQLQNTVHFEMKKLSNNSSWDFEYVLHTSDTY